MNAKVRVGLVALFSVLLGLGVWKSMSEAPDASGAVVAQDAGESLENVRLLTGSAKFDFLNDPEMKQVLAKEGLAVTLTKSGAFAADVLRSAEFDAVWPAGASAATDFSAAWKTSSTYPVFSTPLTIASWKQLLPVFEANGLASKVGDHVEFHLDKALPLMVKGTRWNQLTDNTVFAVNKGFLVNTPDVRKSSSSALYIAQLAYIMNNAEVPGDVATGAGLAEKLSSLITRQGFQEGTLAGPFEDYVGQGMGKAPMVLVYESQFASAKRAGSLRDTAMLMYPQPGMLLKHVLVARTQAGKKLGEVLANNPKAQQLAAKYGFRTNNAAVFAAAMKEVKLDAPELINLADAPSTKVLEGITQTLVSKLEGN